DRVYNRTLTINEDIGLRLLQPLPGYKQFRSSLAFGPDFKKYHSSSLQSRVFQATIFIPETGVVGPPFTTFTSPPTKTSRRVTDDIRYLPLSLNWEGSLNDSAGATLFNANNSFTWSALFDNDDNFRASTGSRRGDGSYYIGSFGLTRDQKLLPGDWTNSTSVLTCWSLHLHADGQIANQPLISNEQFGNGGNAGVRGYRDGQIYSDNGWRTQVEL